MTPMPIAAIEHAEQMAASFLLELIPLAATTIVVVAFLAGANWLLLTRRPDLSASQRLPRQMVLLGLTVVGLVSIALSLPLNEALQGQLLALVGVVLTGIVGLSSTTLIANAMAGLMLRSVQSFRVGDFVRVGDNFGRVTERGLLHTEVQTEDRDLVTLPNLFLIQNPVRVVRTSGTIISASLSLGYDLNHERIEELLRKAVEAAGLEEPFVQVVELGDFSVTYRAAGFLTEVKQLISARSRLRRSILDTLHGAGVEIVSPTFMNQRQLGPDIRMIPRPERRRAAVAKAAEEVAPEEIIFDKAEEAEKVELLQGEQKELAERVDTLTRDIAAASEEDRSTLEQKLAEKSARLAEVDRELAELSKPEGPNEDEDEDKDEDPERKTPEAATSGGPAVADGKRVGS